LLIRDGTSLIDIGSLQSAGHSVYAVAGPEAALRNFCFARPDLVLIDLCQAGLDGKQTIERLRGWTDVPIVVLSYRNDDLEKIACLDLGADDFLVKPIGTGELLARLRAALRRAFGVPRSQLFKSGELTIDFSKRAVLMGELQIRLTATEYELLKAMASHAGVVRTHNQLIHELWGATRYQDAVHLLRVTMSNLRRKLTRSANARTFLVTEPGVGYRLELDAGMSAAREVH